MKKRIMALIVIICVVLLFSACGGGKSEQTPARTGLQKIAGMS